MWLDGVSVISVNRSSGTGRPLSDLISEKTRNVSDLPNPGRAVMRVLTSLPSWWVGKLNGGWGIAGQVLKHRSLARSSA